MCLNHTDPHSVTVSHGLKGNKPASVKQNYANKLPAGVFQSTLVPETTRH
jgi:hypothetical protein